MQSREESTVWESSFIFTRWHFVIRVSTQLTDCFQKFPGGGGQPETALSHRWHPAATGCTVVAAASPSAAVLRNNFALSPVSSLFFAFRIETGRRLAHATHCTHPSRDQKEVNEWIFANIV